jgi:hypothetical protein
MHICLYSYIYIYTFMYMYVSHVHMYVCICMCVCVRAHVYRNTCPWATGLGNSGHSAGTSGQQPPGAARVRAIPLG